MRLRQGQGMQVLLKRPTNRAGQFERMSVGANLPAFLETDFRSFTDYRSAKSTTLDDKRHNQTTIDPRHDRALVGRLRGG